MKGKMLILLLLLAVLPIYPPTAGAALSLGKGRPVEVMVADCPLSGALVLEGTTYVPLRKLMEALGDWHVSWDEESRQATAVSELMALRLPIGEETLWVDGYAAYDCKPAFLLKNTTYVPLRTVAELCGAEVIWRGWAQPVEVIPSAVEIMRAEDIYWLSRIISAESRGESLEGQLAVGAVVLNRLEDEAYPNTIYEVIFEYDFAYQFEPVENGSIYLEPTEQSVLAAKLCLNGTRELEDCLYFFNPTLSEGAWIQENRDYYTTIGCHRFYT